MAKLVESSGSNNAAKGAAVYLRRILEQGEGPFEAPWMRETFEPDKADAYLAEVTAV